MILHSMHIKRAALAFTLLVCFSSLVACRASSNCSDSDARCDALIAGLLFIPYWKPVARVAYSTNSATNSVMAVKIDSKTGAVASIAGSFSAGTAPNVVVADSSAKFLYCASFTSDTVSVFAINEGSGTLTLVQTVNTPGGSNPAGLVLFSDFLMVSQRTANQVQVYRRDPSTGMLTIHGSAVAAGTEPRHGVVHPNGRFIYVGLENGALGVGRLTANNGTLTYGGNIALTGGATNLYTVTITYDGRFVIASALGGSRTWVYSVDQTTGALTEVYSVAATSTVSHGIVAHPYLPVVYLGFDSVSSNIEAFQISNSGALTLLSTITVAAGFNRGLAVDPQGGFLYSVNSSQGFVLAPLSPSTGAFTTGSASAVAPGGTPVHVTLATSYQAFW
ncbi:MAG: beta-propeller fold lactonase family protein [Leptospirales bacterium]|nr:beta-propeller fold lactonase family protein [Leptospirales bacterium]